MAGRNGSVMAPIGTLNNNDICSGNTLQAYDEKLYAGTSLDYESCHANVL